MMKTLKKFVYPLEHLCLPQGVRVPPFNNHWFNRHLLFNKIFRLNLYFDFELFYGVSVRLNVCELLMINALLGLVSQQNNFWSRYSSGQNKWLHAWNALIWNDSDLTTIRMLTMLDMFIFPCLKETSSGNQDKILIVFRKNLNSSCYPHNFESTAFLCLNFRFRVLTFSLRIFSYFQISKVMPLSFLSFSEINSTKLPRRADLKVSKMSFSEDFWKH